MSEDFTQTTEPASLAKFIVKHLNSEGTTFFTRISAVDERDAQTKLEAHHVGNRTTHVYTDEGQDTIDEIAVLNLSQEP